MAQFSMGQPPLNNHKPSRLRHAEQVFESDNVVPETQHDHFQPHYRLDPDDEPLLPHEQDFISRNACKPSVDPGEVSQLLTVRPLTYGFGIEVPSRRSTEPSTFQFGKVKRAVNKTSAPEVLPEVQLPVQLELVVPSIEPVTSNSIEQEMNTNISVALPPDALPTAEQHSRTEVPDRKDTRGRNKSQPPEGSSTTLANRPSAQGFESSPLDAALESIRTACVLERDQVQDRMATVVNILEKDKAGLQNKVLEQQNKIAGLEVQVKTMKEKFSKLDEKATTHQRYAAGLQKDYEKIQKSMTTSQEQNKQALQDQILTITEEKKTLQMSFNSTIDDLTNNRRKMQKTMEEVWMHYVMSLSDKRDLENRINEHVRMYEYEKSRRIDVEEQLLSSLQDTQRQLSESSGTFIDKASTFYTNLKEREAEERNGCGIKDCLEILQKLDAKPLMTADDVRRAESILCSVRQRTNAGFKTLNRTIKERSLTIDSVRDCMRNEAQDLQAEITQNNQAILDGCHTREQAKRLEAELEACKHKLQQLEQQEGSSRKHEEILKSHITHLETERNELQATIDTRQAQSDKMELGVKQLRDQLSEAETRFRSVQNEAKRRERLRVEQEQAFRMYRLNAVPHLARSKEQLQQLTAQIQVRDIEQHSQSQDLLDSNNKLVAIEQQCTELLREVSEHKSTVAKFHKDKEAVEANHVAQISGLQQRLNMLEDAKDSSDEQMHRVELDAKRELEQTKAENLTQIDELKTQVNLSENARKEAQAKVCQIEAANMQQLECHRQETNTKFEKLTIESNLVVARLKKEHLQELEETRHEFDIKFKNHVLEANRQLAEARAGTTDKVLVYNSQSSAEQILKPASQQPQIAKIRKKVDRQTNSVHEVVPSTQLRVDTDRQASTIDRPHPLNTGREGSVYQNEGFFDEEYQSRFGSQPQLREQAARLSTVDPDSEVVPETQEFTFAQLESQKSAADELQQEEIMSDLSIMPSDDLSEMLLDVGPSHGQEHETSRHVPSPDEILEDLGQSGACPASDAQSTSSQGRPISRANTASRMMPLSTHSKPRQYRQADNVVHDPMRGQSYASRNSMHENAALGRYETGAKRKAHDDSFEQGSRSKKVCASTRYSNQGPSLTSKSYTPYSPTPDGALSNEDAQPSPHSTTGRRSSKRTSSTNGPQAGTPRLSSTRNTRSKGRWCLSMTTNTCADEAAGNKFSARFDQELERH
ncbi:hypothetical protein N0V94_002438 [Neodidymelliopsis sp. IMI 364377]|nr:hypothetical protein N0V94_002438 [Neodidymelliopsis sp. IMI 364377]